jgi:hypothetical protein
VVLKINTLIALTLKYKNVNTFSKKLEFKDLKGLIPYIMFTQREFTFNICGKIGVYTSLG